MMKFDDWKNTWKKQENELRPYSEEELLHIVDSKMSVFDQKIRWRDRLEVTACAVGMIIFGIAFFYIPSWFTKLGCVILVLSCLGICYKLIAARFSGKKRSHSFGQSMDKQLRAELHKAKNQKKLLTNILWWYLLPVFMGLVFFTVGMNVAILIKIAYLVLVFVGYAYIWKMNKNAVRDKLEPIIGSLHEAIDVIEKKSV